MKTDQLSKELDNVSKNVRRSKEGQFEINYMTISLHFKYFCVIAVMIIIGIATEKWSGNKEFTIYLSNAATMTSLLLGLVAIFYSFISNDGMSRSLGSITSVSTEVREIRGEIESFANLTEAATQESANNTKMVRDASNTLSQSLSNLSITLTEISDQNNVLKSLVSALPTRIDQLESNVAKVVGDKPQSTSIKSARDVIAPNIVKRFLERASLYQNLLSYACVKAQEIKKPLSIERFCKAVSLDAPYTFDSFLRCMHAVLLCDIKPTNGDDRIYEITSVDTTLIETNRTYLIDFIERNYSEKKDKKEEWLRKISAVDDLFI